MPGTFVLQTSTWRFDAGIRQGPLRTSTIMVGVLHSSCAVVVHCIAVAMMSRATTTPTEAKVTPIWPATRLHHTMYDVSLYCD